MNLNVSDIFFSKHDIAIFEDLFSQLVDTQLSGKQQSPKDRVIHSSVMMQMLNLIRLSKESQSLIVAYMKSAGHFERKDFYIFLRLASILHAQQQVSKESVCRFDTPHSFLELITEAVRKISSDRDRMSIALPPPPDSSKSKLKRVHTISGPPVRSSQSDSLISATMNPCSSSVNAILVSTTNESANVAVDNSSATTMADATSPGGVNAAADLTRKYSAHSSNDNEMDDDDTFDFWRITSEQKEYYKKQFSALQGDILGTVRGTVAKGFFEKSGLPITELSSIWKLSDVDRDGALALPEFCIAMHLTVLRRNSVELPETIPDSLLQIFSSLAADGYCPAVSPYGSSTSSSSAFIRSSAAMDDLADKMKCHSMRSSADDGTDTGGARGTASSSVNSTKNWTQFNNSPLPTSSAESTSRASPEQQPVNFDYNAESIAANPAIKHPVALRYSPSTTSPSVGVMVGYVDRVPTDDASLSPGEFNNSSSRPESTSNNFSLPTNPFPSSASGDWHLSPSAANNTEVTISPASAAFWSNGNNNYNINSMEQSYLIPSDGQLESLNGLEERIIARYRQPTEVIIPKSFASPEELQSTLRALQEYANTVTKQNQSLLTEMLSLVKVARKVHHQLSTALEPSSSITGNVVSALANNNHN